MDSTANECDIEFELHFLDCEPQWVFRSLEDNAVMDHLYRAATNRILKFETFYQREESDRVTDIDQLILHSPDLIELPQRSRQVSIEITTDEVREVSIPIIKSDTIQSPRSPIELRTAIPPAPLLPPSLDAAIKLQSQAARAVTPDQGTLWADVSR